MILLAIFIHFTSWFFIALYSNHLLITIILPLVYSLFNGFIFFEPFERIVLIFKTKRGDIKLSVNF